MRSAEEVVADEAARPDGPIQRNLGRYKGTRLVRPARVKMGTDVYLLHADGTVYSVRLVSKPVPGKPGFVEASETSRRVKDPDIVRAVQRLYRDQAGPR